MRIKIKKSNLQVAAEELNKVLDLEPRINVEATVQVLANDIKSVLSLIEEDDELSIATTDTIDKLKKDKSAKIENTDEKKVMKTKTKEEKPVKEAKPVKEEQPIKTSKINKKSKTSTIGITDIICQMICADETLTCAQIKTEVDKRDLTYSNSTISTVIGDTKRTLRILRELKKLK